MFDEPIQETDPKIAEAIQDEVQRQEEGLELIASENFVSRAVLEAAGSVLTNKYAEGYPDARYYGGCENMDTVESLAIDRACELFDCEYANVQPHAGSQANMATYMALIEPGDTIMSMDLTNGGHLTHGAPVNFSGQLYDIAHYKVDEESEVIEEDHLREVAAEAEPDIVLAGYSAYPREIPFEVFADIADEHDAYFVVDVAHIAGLIAKGVHPSPFPEADVVTTTTHKTLRGARGGLILTNQEELIDEINSQIFPGIQGGPLMHIIAAKAVAFKEALQPDFEDYQIQLRDNARKLGDELDERGYHIVSGGTDTHLLLVDLRPKGLTGKQAEEALDEVNITTNKNTVPGETESPFVTSGIRLGTPALTTRGMEEDAMVEVADLIDRVLSNLDDPEIDTIKDDVRNDVRELTEEYPLYPFIRDEGFAATGL
jgi:glycine hydroxymethyltransferase